MSLTPTAKLMSAIQFSALKHRRQRRLDPEQTPFVNHPINVAAILAKEGCVQDDNVIIAAILHDTVEDTDTTFEEIEQNFGKAICNIVREVTDDKSLPKEVRKKLQVENAKKCSNQAKLIKLADKLDNLRDLMINTPTGWTEERKQDYFVWAKQVVDNLRGTSKQLECLLDEIFREKNLL